MNIGSRTPGVVDSVDRARREVRVKIPGMTDGADVQPLAEIEYPIGDNSEYTEIRISPGDRVWLAFINGDPRYPIITGFRTKHTDNEVGTRRFHHDNIETEADETQKHTAGTSYTIEAGETQTQSAGKTFDISAGDRVTVTVGGTTIECTDGEVKITTEQFTVDASQSTFTGDVRIDGGVRVGEDVITDAGISHNNHDHVGNLGAPTSPPLPG